MSISGYPGSAMPAQTTPSEQYSPAMVNHFLDKYYFVLLCNTLTDLGTSIKMLW